MVLPSLNFHIPCGVQSVQVSLVLSCRGASCHLDGHVRDQLITSASDTWQEESLCNYRPSSKPDHPAGYEPKGGKGGVAK